MLEESIFNYYKQYYKDTLGLPNWEYLATKRIDEEASEEKRIINFENRIGPVDKKILLNIGCGTGGFNVVATKKGAIAYGIDPDKEAIRICHLKAEKYKIPKERFLLSNAEKLPFENDTFDFINCYTVLEHVNNVREALQEMVRVTKSGGKIYTNSPHYWCLYEGHYKVFWCPLFLIRPIGRLYLFLRGRPTSFFDTLNFLNNTTIHKALKQKDTQILHYKKKLVKETGLIGLITYLYYRLFDIDSNIEIVITKH